VGGAANAVTSAAQAATGVPGGSGYYCRTTSGAVHFTSSRPIPIAVEVYFPYWDGHAYNARPAHPLPMFKNN
jgi:hypothetical protein